ncbi:unnamed protein product [Acanthoscelides obtectus]|uniref:Uncharacterized protein n=1 Tax=Acanthoscelides obtectus TaxID=200917 RepID=A0A9P0M313_ACAOB|nr:unnamed protein product [Acanthoscelides obtectus]CAK1671814.1 hypothetical protein AOBTE_LOCUS28480 [Acanthoscelides obtectus]
MKQIRNTVLIYETFTPRNSKIRMLVYYLENTLLINQHDEIVLTYEERYQWLKYTWQPTTDFKFPLVCEGKKEPLINTATASLQRQRETSPDTFKKLFNQAEAIANEIGTEINGLQNHRPSNKSAEH